MSGLEFSTGWRSAASLRSPSSFRFLANVWGWAPAAATPPAALDKVRGLRPGAPEQAPAAAFEAAGAPRDSESERGT